MVDVLPILLGTLQGILSSTGFILVLFIGFCVVVGFTKVKRSAGAGMVVKSLEESLNRQPVVYLLPNAPRGPADQLKCPELLEKPSIG